MKRKVIENYIHHNNTLYFHPLQSENRIPNKSKTCDPRHSYTMYNPIFGFSGKSEVS